MAQLKSVNYALKQYYESKAVHIYYLKAKDKKKFREEHSGPLSIYDAAVRGLLSAYGKDKFQPCKEIQSNLSALRS